VWGKYIAILRNVKRREASQWKYQLLRAHPENQKNVSVYDSTGTAIAPAYRARA